MPNHLAAQPSAYLQSAAHQPVHWHPWGPAAFARARSENKPILLDIGAVWCHWCHVMDGESYEDAGVAEVLNREFVCIKVDRDERPDVDARYQRAVQALTGQGGWPLTAFLTADGEVFFGGTYFPPEVNSYGRPGFLSVLRQVAEIYRQQRAKVAENARAIRDHVARSLDEAERGAVGPETLERAAADMARLFDVRYGGFGTAPKFPHPAAVRFLVARWHDTHAEWIREVVEKTLLGMAKGGIHDHLGGGFHRYAVDERWIVPHFEKMAYDNSELLHAYLDAAQALGHPLFREVAHGIVEWVFDVLSDADGHTFYTSQDADVQFGDDGDYWTWTPAEVHAALHDEEAERVLRRVYDIEEHGEMHHHPQKNVLWWRADPADDGERRTWKEARRRLKQARDRRPAPFVDTTPYVNWNAMMASAFLHAGAVLDRPACNRLALGVLERIWREAWDESEGMRHVIGRAEPRGLLEDNVHAAAAFLDAYEATGEDAWTTRATLVMDHCRRAHWDEEQGGFFDVARGGSPADGGAAYLATPAKPVQDAPTPSANGVAALVLARLAALTDPVTWRPVLDRQLATFGGAAPQLSVHGATLLRAIDWALNPVTRIEVRGPRGPGPACDMHLLALQTYRPRTALLRTTADQPAATVCVGTTCSLPVGTTEALRALLA
ncbi:MAG TPA: thioredoxin domain-containing protein [Gemmatimonadales bacterium]|nr:thioredoxin domain-containing protein [Gemmatimonadales bacterium]